MGNRLLLALALMGGCGGEDGPSPWLGNWNRTGTQSTTCGLQSGTNQLTGVVIVTATLRPNQTCTVSVNGFNVTVTGTQGSLTLNSNTITGSEAGSTNNGCSFMQQMTLTRM